MTAPYEPDRRAKFDPYSPREIAELVENVGIVKARLPLLQLAMLGMLAGAFIGLGALYFTLVTSDATLGFAAARVLGGVAFSLGLLLVVVAGAELFTGNNLLAMAWAEGKVSTPEVLHNWTVVCFANFVGAAGLAALVFFSGHLGMNGGAVANQAVRIAAAKVTMPAAEMFFRSVLCNILVCMAIWMAFAGRSVIDKAIAIVFPISAFVAAGFEHSIANMYFIPLAMLQQAAAPVAVPGADLIDTARMLRNLGIVIAGNIVGGSVLVALVYHVIYRRGGPAPSRSDSDRQHG
ncbi:MAG: formate transporter FocA [Betaproteobacteria bacterium RIFCSPLOWO2_02_FULL_65_20]|nr:MAG: formate transporter FocA [Betaproteobacteria bacterium RIFCSPLOWO2_02_FULL_65_20]